MRCSSRVGRGSRAGPRPGQELEGDRRPKGAEGTGRDVGDKLCLLLHVTQDRPHWLPEPYPPALEPLKSLGAWDHKHIPGGGSLK